MNFQHLKYYQMVYESKNITKAAEQLHISQPAVSSAIRELEVELGVTLFLRQNRGLVETEEGKIFYQSACKMLELCESTKFKVRESAERRCCVRVGMAPMAGNVIFPKIYRRLAEEHPQVELEILEDGSYELKKDLDEERVEVILVTDRMAYPELEKCEIYRSQIVFAIRKDHPLAQSAKLDIRQLAEVPIAVFRKGYALSQQISELFESYGVHPKIMAQTSNFVTIQSLIKCGAAGGFLMREVCEEEPDLVYFDVPELETFPIYLAWKKKAYLSIAAKDFISSCLQIQDIKNIYG